MEYYHNLGRKFGKGPGKFNEWLLEKYPKAETLMCFPIGYDRAKGVASREALPIHIRNCVHHPEHGKYTKSQLQKAIKFLSRIK